MKRAPGRPPMPEGKAHTEILTIRLSKEERVAIDAAARIAGAPVTRWARLALLAAAGLGSGGLDL